MEEWKEYKLGEFMQFNPKERIAKGQVARKIAMDQLVPYCRDVSSNTYEEYKGGAKFKNGDTIMARITPCLENGKTSYISSLEPDEVAFGSTEYIVLRNIQDISDSRFVYYLSICPQIREVAIKSMVGSSGRQRVQQDVLENYCMNLPSLPTQQKIANILSSLDDKIEVNRRINEQLEELAQALFKSWFVDFEPFKDGKFVESELGMIPKGWKVTKLDEVSSYISRGLTPKYDNDSDEIILGQTCVRNNIVTLNNGRKHRPKKKNEKWIQQWDILINSTGVGSLGRVGVVYFDKDNVAIDSHITVVRPISSLYKHYIGRTLLNKQTEIEYMAIGSTGQTELPKDSVKSMLILLPIDDILVLFNKSIEPICKLMYSNLEEITHLTNLRDTLLPKLMSGEIKI